MARNRAATSLRKEIVLLRRTSLTGVQRGDNRAIDLRFLPVFQQPHLSFRVARMVEDPSHLLFVKVKPDIDKGDVWAALEYLATAGHEFEGIKCATYSFKSRIRWHQTYIGFSDTRYWAIRSRISRRARLSSCKKHRI
jgi:hypothetical protein